jgi:hypothetical protein
MENRAKKPDWLIPSPEDPKGFLMPSCVEASEGERPVKQYFIASLRSARRMEKAQAKILVTNKRLVFRAYGKSPLGCAILQREFAIGEIKGIESRLGRRLSVAGVAAGLAFVLAFAAVAFWLGRFLVTGSLLLAIISSSVASFSFMISAVLLRIRMGAKAALSGAALGMQASMFIVTGYPAFIASTAFAALASTGLACLRGLVPELSISVLTAEGKASVLKSGRLDYGKVSPSKDVLSLIHELGAIVRDIQEMGEAGADKWRGGAALVFKGR